MEDPSVDAGSLTRGAAPGCRGGGVTAASRQAPSPVDPGLPGLVGRSPAMREITRLVRKLARSRASTVLLLGETGVGKGELARALHFESAVGERPFVTISCASIPEALLESELFGHEKGAFTDANRRKIGLLELADGGTAFLDEVGDLPLPLQGKLLRFLEDRVIRPVGSTRERRVDVRLVAAASRDLERDAAEGRFRADLLFRLKVVPIVVPPLRERLEDLPLLVEALLARLGETHRHRLRGVSPAAMRCLEAYSWPGNVRELRGVLERAAVLAEGPLLVPEDLPPEIQEACCRAPEGGSGVFTLPPGGIVFEEVERNLITQALRRARGNQTRAARLLGLTRNQLRYRVHKFALEELTRRGS